MEFIFGPMDGFIKVIGIKENNMVLEIIQFLDNQKNQGYGKKVREFYGLIKIK